MTKKITFAVALAAAALVTPAANAATNIDFRTGTDVDSNGEDDNWSVNGGNAYLPTANQLPDTYAPNDASSSWITPVPRAGTAAPGTYNFLGTVSLSDVGSVQSWQVTWFADNIVRRIIVNGTQIFDDLLRTSQSMDFKAPGTSMLFNQTVWQNGVNTVVFEIENGTGPRGNPVALRMSSVINAVPEPGTWMLMILGLGAVGFAMRRRQKAAVRFQFA